MKSIGVSFPTRQRWLAAAMLLAGLMTLPGSAVASLHADQVLPTLCQPSNESYVHGNHVYRSTSFVNEDLGNPWDLEVAMCPVNRFRPGDRVEELRIFLSGDKAEESWCRLYEAPSGEAVDFNVASEFGGLVAVTFDPTILASLGYVALTVECLLHPGTSIDSIELIWDI